MSQTRRMLVLNLKAPAHVTADGEPQDERFETRAFMMSDRQADLFDRAAAGLVRAGADVKSAVDLVEKIIYRLLAGQIPQATLPKVVHEMRLAFPILQRKHLEKLPIAGCPHGRIEALVVGIKTKSDQRSVVLNLDDDQQQWFDDTMRAAMERDDMSRDEAWLWTSNFVGRLISGAKMIEDCEEPLVMRAVNLFDHLSTDQVLELPIACEQDVLRWCFRKEVEE